MNPNVKKRENLRYIQILYEQPLTYYATKELNRLMSQLQGTDVVLLLKRKRTDDCLIHLAIQNKNNLLVFTTSKTSDNIQDVIKYLFERSPNCSLIMGDTDSANINKVFELIDCLIILELHNDP